MDSVGQLAVALSLPFDGPAGRRAAEHLLAASAPDELLERLYPTLVWHKCWRHALGHISRAGGDLSRLSFSTQLFRRSFPVKGRRLWRQEVVNGERVTLDDWDRLLRRHQEFLCQAVEELLNDGGEVVLLSGRALGALYPEYVERMEFDSDVLTADRASGVATMRRLAGRGYVVRGVRAREPDGGAEAALERYRQGHSITLGLEMRSLPHLDAPIWQRARWVEWRGRRVRAAAAEDLLLMVAARIRSQRSLQWVSVNDATVILRRDADDLEWDYLESTMRAHGLLVHFRLLLETAERAAGGELISPEQRARFDLSRPQSLLLGWARSLDLTKPEEAGRMSTGGLGARWLERLTWRSATASLRPTPGPVLGPILDGFERLAYRTRLRLSRMTSRRFSSLLGCLGLFHPHLGSLCELRGDRLDVDASFCLTGRRRRRMPHHDSPGLLRLRKFSASIPGPGITPHDCYRFEYRLDRRANRG